MITNYSPLVLSICLRFLWIIRLSIAIQTHKRRLKNTMMITHHVTVVVQLAFSPKYITWWVV